MKRNTKNIVRANDELNPLPRNILAQMGPEGHAIQKRLKKFLNKLTPDHLKDAGSLSALIQVVRVYPLLRVNL
jgi:hypothetical protein